MPRTRPLDDQKGLQLEAGYEQAEADSDWQGWDRQIYSIVGDINNYLSRTPGYQPLDPLFIKAMIWAESGGPHLDYGRVWIKSPMQIGNPHDAGLPELKSHSERVALLLPPNLRADINGSVQGSANITAGVAYLLYRAARWGKQQTTVDKRIEIVTVSKTDTLDSIARAKGTSIDNLQALNKIRLNQIKPGMILKYQKIRLADAILGWKTINTSTVHDLYNGNPKIADYGERVGVAYDFLRTHKNLPFPHALFPAGSY